MVKFWTKEELNKLIQMKASGKTNKEIAKKLGRSEQSISKKYRETNWSELNDEISQEVESDEVLTDDELFKETLINKSMAKVENDKYKKIMMADIIADKMVKAVKALPEVKKTSFSKSVVGKKKDEEQMALMLSDLHIGAEYSKSETGGIAEYSVQIARQRMKNLKHALVDIHELHSKLYDIKTLNIFSLGDLVAGMNQVGAWSATGISNAYPIVDQTIISVQVIQDCIYNWCQIFDNINVYCCYGNHGRVSKSGEQKNHCNWDYVAHKMLQARFKGNKKVKFSIPQTWYQRVEIEGHSFLMTHGDFVRGAGGSPVNGLRTFQQKMTGILGKPSNYVCCGHFHNTAQLRTNSGTALVNGSVCGSDIYSLSMQLHSPASQTLFGISKKRGMTYKYNLDLQNER